MYLTNVAQIEYIQVLPDGSLKLLTKDSNIVTTNLKTIPVHKRVVRNYVPRRQAEVNYGVNYDFVILYWIWRRYLMS